jgi:porin
MLRTLTALLFAVFYSQLFGQHEVSKGILFSTTVSGDFAVNFKGGLKQGNTYIGMEYLTVNFNTGDMGLWKGGNFFIHALNTHGKGPSEMLAGDIQVLSNIEAGDFTGLYQFWYSQQLGNFFFLLGQHDLNSEFAGTKYGGTFISSSFGIVPTLSLNMPVSVFPIAAPCVVLKYESKQHLTYKLGIYDGDPGNFENNRYNLQWNLSRKDGFLSIGQIDFIRKDGDNDKAVYKLGIYYHSGQFQNYSDTLHTKKGNLGVYFITDHALFNRNLHSGRGLCFFVQGGATSPDYNMIHYYLGGGFRYHGILPFRYKDELGLAIANVFLSNHYVLSQPGSLNHELALESTYSFRFGGRYTVQPNFHYIIHPGANVNNKNCLIGIVRFSLTY